jgi:hypothetical protein
MPNTIVINGTIRIQTLRLPEASDIDVKEYKAQRAVKLHLVSLLGNSTIVGPIPTKEGTGFYYYFLVQSYVSIEQYIMT